MKTRKKYTEVPRLLQCRDMSYIQQYITSTECDVQINGIVPSVTTAHPLIDIHKSSGYLELGC